MEDTGPGRLPAGRCRSTGQLKEKAGLNSTRGPGHRRRRKAKGINTCAVGRARYKPSAAVPWVEPSEARPGTARGLPLASCRVRPGGRRGRAQQQQPTSVHFGPASSRPAHAAPPTPLPQPELNPRNAPLPRRGRRGRGPPHGRARE